MEITKMKTTTYDPNIIYSFSLQTAANVNDEWAMGPS
jgi:hypothetical protein